MNRYDISNDFRKKFIDENKNVWSQTIRPVYISINGDEAKCSTNPYSMENAEHGVVLFTYTYTVITQADSSMVSLFFNANGEIEDYISIDGWKLRFSSPTTALNRSNGPYVYFRKDDLSGSVGIGLWTIKEDFPKIWKLFSVVRRCTSQVELDYVIKSYNQEIDIENLKAKNLKQEATIDALNIQLESYKGVLNKIKELLGV